MANHVIENHDFYYDTPRVRYTPYIYPHPLTKELVLGGIPADQIIHLDWQVKTILPFTSKWRIDYTSQTGTAYLPITGITNTDRAYTRTGLTSHEWYTITLRTMVNTTSILSDTVRVMPTDRFVYLPLLIKVQ